jgi:hypothetical protein
MGRIILTEEGRHEAPSGTGLWLSAADALRITGWELKPEGMCRGAVCVPLPAGAARAGEVDLAAFWAKLGAPVVSDGGAVWSVGVAPQDRRAALETLEAPDFTLPDLDGRMHSLSDLRGKKTLLVTWASW